jgi:hypothetical protein
LILNIIPMGVPLEWNVFMIWGVVTLFLGHPGVDVGALANPALIGLLGAALVAMVVYGNLRPDKVSFLMAMRYYAGNWAATFWCFRGDALDRFERNVVSASLLPHQQLEKVYGSAQAAAVPLFMGYAFRGFHTHGRALWTLVPRACGPEHEDYLVLDGELVAGTALGWNFGDGHLHDEQLIAALQSRCDFQPGDVRIVYLESQPFHRSTQQYRLIDAATGEIERGYVEVADLVSCQPTDADIRCTPSPPAPREHRARTVIVGSGPNGLPPRSPLRSRPPRHGARGRRRGGRWRPFGRAHPARPGARRVLRRAPSVVALPRLAAAGRPRAESALARHRPGPPARRAPPP